MTEPRVSRNDPCPCGSGLKYKKCHEGKDAEKPGRSGWLTMAVLGLLVVGGATAVVITFAREGGNALRTGGRAGQVWSPEHGHWHDASAPASGAPLGAGATGGQKLPPPGTPPPGKVWSAEHGHWHDAAQPVPGLAGTPAALPPAGQPGAAPPGPAPPGKVWSAEHGHFHDAPQPIPGLATPAPAAPPPPQPNP